MEKSMINIGTSDGKNMEHDNKNNLYSCSDEVTTTNLVVRLSDYITKGIDLSILEVNKNKYCGNPTNEIKRLCHSGQRLVSFANKGQMKCMNVTVAKYNKRNKYKTGVKVKCHYDYNNLLILFYLSSFVQVSLEESQSCQEEPQCAPP